MSFDVGRIGPALPGSLSSFMIKAAVDKDLLQKLSHTADFDTDELRDVVVTRRGTTFPIQLRTSKKARLDKVAAATLVYVFDDGKEVELELVSLGVRVYGADLQVCKYHIPRYHTLLRDVFKLV